MEPDEALLAAIHEEVTLHPFDARWARAFEDERARLLAAFRGRFIAIEHIGSTAVDGMIAKPVVDILAGVASMADADALVAPLCSLGYTTSLQFNATLADSRWLMRCSEGHRTHHLHIAVHGSHFWNRRIRFRDVLRSDPAIAEAYAHLKTVLAARHWSDREAYTQGKSDFIRAATAVVG